MQIRSVSTDARSGLVATTLSRTAPCCRKSPLTWSHRQLRWNCPLTDGISRKSTSSTIHRSAESLGWQSNSLPKGCMSFSALISYDFNEQSPVPKGLPFGASAVIDAVLHAFSISRHDSVGSMAELRRFLQRLQGPRDFLIAYLNVRSSSSYTTYYDFVNSS